MTGEFEHEPLDDLLQQWAEAKSSSQEGLSQLRQRIAIERDRLDTDGIVVSPIQGNSGFWRAVSLIAIGTSLLLLIALGLSWFSQPRNDKELIANAPQFVLPTISNLELANKRILVSELQRIFDRHFAWIVETNGEVHLGVDQDHVQLNDAVPIVVRLAVVCRKTSQTQWKHVWSADVVSRSEQLVELSLASEGDTRLLIWAYALPDGMIAVEGEMRLPGEEAVRPTFSELKKSGDSSKVFTTTLGDTEYQVFQTVELLDGRVI